jgi:spore germination cell wall hydrolase CwlJ-like protein
MSMLKSWTKSALVLFVLAQAAHAEMAVSQSNNPAAALGVSLVELFGQENAALETVEPGRMQKIVTPPVKKSAKSVIADASAMTYDATWIDAVPMLEKSADLDCLARAVYFEARGESIKGQAAVAEVVLNRVDTGQFPGTICGVVQQGGKKGCQFSFTCDGRKDVVRDRSAWYVAEKVASALIAGAPREVTQGATYFHTPAVRPSWAKRFDMTIRIGQHYFYREPIRTASN